MLKRLLFIVIAILLAVLSLSVITVRYQRQPQVLAVVDDAQHELHFFDLPERIVVLEPGVAHLIQQWERESLVVATTADLSPIFPMAENLGERTQVTALQLITTRPDLIILSADHSLLSQELREAGLPAILVVPERIKDLLEWPETLGLLLAADQRALLSTRSLAEQMNEFRVQALKKPSAGRRVIWVIDEQWTVAGNNTVEGDLLELVGVRNVAAVFSRYRTLKPADIHTLAPEVIIAPVSLLPQLQPLATSTQNQLGILPPQLVPLEPQPQVIGWHDVFTRAEQLLLFFQPTPPLPEE